MRHAASLVRKGAVFPLGVPFTNDGPHGGAELRRNPLHLMRIDGGDDAGFRDYVADWAPLPDGVGRMYGSGPMRFTDDYLIAPTHTLTHWDALAHVYYDGQLYNGHPAGSVTSFGARHVGIDKVQAKGITSRGILLDLPRGRGVDALEPGAAVEPDELDAVIAAAGLSIRSGDILLLRTGWWRRWVEEGVPFYREWPGLSWRCAAWLHDHEIAAVAADNPAVETAVSGVDGVFLPLHLLCLRDMGLMFGEVWDLEALAEDCAADGVYECQLVAPPLQIPGGVGSPMNPVALK